MRIGRAVDDHLALVHHLAVVRHHVLVFRDQVLVGDAVQVGDDQALLALRILAERDRARDFGEHARILGRTRFEELGHPRQTAGDVTRLRRLLRNARKHFAHADFLAVAHGDDRTDLEGDVDRNVGARDLHFLTVLVDQLHLRPQALRLHAAAPLRIDHHECREPRHLVDLTSDRDTLFHVLELHPPGVLRDDRTRVRIPGREHLACLHGFVVAREQHGAVRHFVPLTLAVVLVVDHDFAVARDRDELTALVGDVTHAGGVVHDAVRLAFDLARDRRPRRRATDVERAHRELRARLADRLRGDDADRFADVHRHAAAEIATVALARTSHGAFRT